MGLPEVAVIVADEFSVGDELELRRATVKEQKLAQQSGWQLVFEFVRLQS